MLAIDFGTSRTKVAYFDAGRRRAALAALGAGDQIAFPTLFYVGVEGHVFVGSEALDFLDTDPGGIVRRVKSKLRERAVRVNGQSLRPVQLVTHLFATVRQRVAEEIPAFGGVAPTSVVLTLPAAGAGSGPVVEKIMRDAAISAGFTDVDLITEPEGAAVAWQREEGGGSDEVVVILDGGGGTVDWACLRRIDGKLRLFADCPPGGDDKVGGEYLDEELFALLTAKLESEGSVHANDVMQGQANKWFAHVRKLRERFNRTGKLTAMDALRVDGKIVQLDDAEVRDTIRDRFVDQVCDGFGRYLDSVRAATGVLVPRVLLVGGTGQISGLKEALRDRCRCEPTWWQLSEFAPVLGGAWLTAGESESRPGPIGRASTDSAERAIESSQNVPAPKVVSIGPAAHSSPVPPTVAPPDDSSSTVTGQLVSTPGGGSRRHELDPEVARSTPVAGSVVPPPTVTGSPPAGGGGAPRTVSPTPVSAATSVPTHQPIAIGTAQQKGAAPVIGRIDLFAWKVAMAIPCVASLAFLGMWVRVYEDLKVLKPDTKRTLMNDIILTVVTCGAFGLLLPHLLMKEIQDAGRRVDIVLPDNTNEFYVWWLLQVVPTALAMTSGRGGWYVFGLLVAMFVGPLTAHAVLQPLDMVAEHLEKRQQFSGAL